MAGQRKGVKPNGFCWLISLLTAFGAMDDPLKLTEVDLAVINDVVQELQKFYRAERDAGYKWALSLGANGLGKQRGGLTTKISHVTRGDSAFLPNDFVHEARLRLGLRFPVTTFHGSSFILRLVSCIMLRVWLRSCATFHISHLVRSTLGPS